MIDDVQPLIVAHRGSSSAHAEHTLDAYLAAVDDGADGLECDVQLSRDGHLVCVHDRTLDRTSTGRGPVSRKTLAELQTLDYARWRTDLAPARFPGLLTLRALLELALDTGSTLFVETKHPVRFGPLVETRLIELLHEFSLTEPRDKQDSPIVLMSFSAAALRRMATLAPALPTVRLSPGRPPRDSPADLVGPGISWLRANQDFAATADKPIYCWTVDEPADVLSCQRAGVRYLATNDPARTRRILGKPGH